MITFHFRWIPLLSGLSENDLTHYHDQAVDKNNTEGHNPCANVNYINLCLLCYGCLDLPRRSKTSKVKHRSAEDGKDQKSKDTAATVYWSQLSIYLLWMIGILLDQRAFTYHGILIRSLVNHATRACKIANHASRCDARSRVTRIIWVQLRVTLQLLGPLRVTQKPFATLFDVACNFTQPFRRMTIKKNVLFRIIVKSAADKCENLRLSSWIALNPYPEWWPACSGLALFDSHQSVGETLFKHSKLDATSLMFALYARGKNNSLCLPYFALPKRTFVLPKNPLINIPWKAN